MLNPLSTQHQALVVQQADYRFSLIGIFTGRASRGSASYYSFSPKKGLRFISLDTWSRMTINLPFSKLVYVAGDPDHGRRRPTGI